MQALVIKSTGSWYEIKAENGQVHQARTKGKLRLSSESNTNPVAVGDTVKVQENPNGDYIIEGVLSRRNYLVRKSNNLSRKKQIIAANVDTLLLVVTLFQPRTSTGFIDRILLNAEAYGINSLLVFNKIDLLHESDLDLLSAYQEIYKQEGYETLEISALQKKNLEQLKQKIAKQTSLITGHSGAGKSTLLNALLGSSIQKTDIISAFSNKGKHTTTFAEMFFLDEDTKIIDTPGIKDFGVVDIEQHEVCQYFKEFNKIAGRCRFHNCSHREEPDCAVKQGLEDGSISSDRYINYLSIVNNEDVHH